MGNNPNATPNAMPTGKYTCEVAVCKDGNTGRMVVIPENRRMEATLIQGATGTGKTYATAEYALAFIENREVDLRKKSIEEQNEINANIYKNDLVFEKGEETVWICRNCGHVHVGKEAPKVCPVCAHPQAYFELRSENY